MHDEPRAAAAVQRDAALPLRLAVVLLIACTQVGATQLTSRVQRGLMAPFAITWCHACLQVLCWPAGNVRRTPTTDALNKSDLAIFPLLFLGANYAYVRALALASPAIVQCVFGAAPAVVCVLSRLWLREPFTRRRGLAVGAALCGVALVAAPSGSGNSHHLTIGVVIALCAVLCAATYKVRWKGRFLAPSPDFVLRAVGLVGGAVAICSLPIAVALAATGAETPPGRWTAHDFWIVLGGGVIDVLYNCSIALGLSVASPVFVATGTILAIPGNAVVDAILDHKRLGPLQLLGALFVVVAFAAFASERPASAPDEETDVANPLVDDDEGSETVV
jgi:drug/metabolite transporter (DMT)-like permease